ncbi:hypothetical protein [Actinocrispum wychmicini]|uniref:Uncharacterized protein n=1 Tax=Actinocrispum wychmicini TaxID=1213861 RepID=A0A4R2IPX2_9PSEU|nr:hypothetical protein [Actinocrispum wychmicini]TCO47411.1 hypothetical protein EV192_117151 [Actinocrispum wychmicini]
MTGVVAASGGDTWWAWAASHLMPAGVSPNAETPYAVPSPEPATVHNQHTGPAHNVVQAGQIHSLHIHGPQQAPDDSAWLRSCWDIVATAGATVEMRYLTRDGKRLDGFLLVRVEGRDRDEVGHRVAAVRDQLGAMPGHVRAAAVTDEARTRWILEPFQPHHEGIVEVRKRLTTQRSSRADAHHPWLAAVTPLIHRRQPWQPLWSALADLPFPAMLSVGLAPFQVGPGLRSHLTARAAALTRLAQQGPPATGLWNVPSPPDEFAIAALALVSDAVRRYTDRAFVARMSLAAAGPVPGLLAELLAETVSARTVNQGFAGAGPVVVRPDPADMPTASSNLSTLNFAPLAAYAQGNLPDAVGELERVLGAIVDLDEAAAAFRLPYESAVFG